MPDKYEEALLENELAGAKAITRIFEIEGGTFTWRYAIAGTDDSGVDSGAPGSYTATEDTITFADSSGWSTTANWELSNDELHLSAGEEIEPELIAHVPWRWYVSYIMSQPFTKVG